MRGVAVSVVSVCEGVWDSVGMYPCVTLHTRGQAYRTPCKAMHTTRESSVMKFVVETPNQNQNHRRGRNVKNKCSWKFDQSSTYLLVILWWTYFRGAQIVDDRNNFKCVNVF